jgi:predicted metalloprotease with PDZ domain
VKLVSVALAALAVGMAGSVSAQTSLPQSPLPQSAPPTPPIPAPVDATYPGGTLRLQVDATDVQRKIFRVHETVPVAGPGPMILLYPKWLPGNHSPSGPIDQLAGLIVTANGQRVEWRRDPVDVYAFHVDVPAGAKALDLDFQFLSPTDTREGRVVMTEAMLDLQWNALVLYPAGYYARGIQVESSVLLPEGWRYGTALEPSGAAAADGAVAFKPVALDVLVDSPMYAGRYFERLDLDPGAAVPVHLDVVADRPEELEIKPEQLEAHRALVRQAARLYGSHHYNHYDFLLSLSDEMSGIGLEHHRSSEDGTTSGYFTDWEKTASARSLLPHEYTHSWNGKFRRPQDLWTPNYDVPMRDSLLWVYEGQTQYWGEMLSARSGLVSKKDELDSWAGIAAAYDHRVGRAWKALQDTTNDPITAHRKPQSWRSWERSEDYYSEGALVWLDADTLIRELSHGRRSLDDFARSFFGVDDGAWGEKTYTFEDVVAALNAVQPYDWASFLRTRLDGHGPGAPLDGIKRGGYRLVYTAEESAYAKTANARRKVTDFMYSVGFLVGPDGKLADVQWDGPAFKAGLTSGTQLVAVNGRAYEADILKDAIKAAQGSGPSVELIVRNGDIYRTVKIDWHEGLKYPHLEREGTGPALLDEILAPKG